MKVPVVYQLRREVQDVGPCFAIGSCPGVAIPVPGASHIQCSVETLHGQAKLI